MKYPVAANDAAYRLSVPQMDGGVNGHDGETQIADNQLTDCLNMWWKDGALRARPGMQADLDINEQLGDYLFSVPFQSRKAIYQDGKIVYKNVGIFSRIQTDINVKLFTTSLDGSTTISDVKTGLSGFACDSVLLIENSGLTNISGMRSNGAIVMIAGNAYDHEVMILGEPADPSSEWVDLKPSLYAPLISINGTPNNKDSGTLIEGFNLLTGAFRCQFTPEGGEGTIYYLPYQNLTLSAGDTVITGITQSGQQITWTIPATGSNDDYIYSSDTHDFDVNGTSTPVYAALRPKLGLLMFTTTNSGAVHYFPYPDYGVKNCIEIKTWKTSKDSVYKIGHMRFGTWFGGDRSGLNGGTRLFVAGNSDYSNLIHWSDVDNPLYFPENNYAYIGNAGSGITALAKQEDKLVIFKNSEMFYATYSTGNSYSAEDYTEGKAVDVTANSAYFPITPIHDTIGCDCPNTIQLCDNRLIWATSDKKVYALTGLNQYSENNVKSVSIASEKWISQLTDDQMSAALSADYDGHYCLIAGREMFVMDYRDNAFVAYILYNTYSKKQENIPWYVWSADIGLDYQCVMSNQDRLICLGTGTFNNSGYLLSTKLTGTADLKPVYTQTVITRSAPIPCRIRSKIFNFSTPEKIKDVPAVYLSLESGNAYDILPTFITDKNESAGIPIKADSSGVVTMRTRRMVPPNARHILQFGLQLESAGAVTIDSIALQYISRTGSVR